MGTSDDARLVQGIRAVREVFGAIANHPEYGLPPEMSAFQARYRMAADVEEAMRLLIDGETVVVLDGQLHVVQPAT